MEVCDYPNIKFFQKQWIVEKRAGYDYTAVLVEEWKFLNRDKARQFRDTKPKEPYIRYGIRVRKEEDQTKWLKEENE